MEDGIHTHYSEWRQSTNQWQLTSLPYYLSFSFCSLVGLHLGLVFDISMAQNSFNFNLTHGMQWWNKCYLYIFIPCYCRLPVFIKKECWNYSELADFSFRAMPNENWHSQFFFFLWKMMTNHWFHQQNTNRASCEWIDPRQTYLISFTQLYSR